MTGEPTRIADRYQLLEEIGRGGMGVVYRARDERLGRLVALKLIDRAIASDADLRARFLREAHALARLRDPGVIAIHDVGEDDQRPWLVMDLCEDGSLADRLARGPLSPAETRELLAEGAKALATVHGVGIVHRDVKPANILRDGDRWVIGDFGIASAKGEHTITRSGMVMGTPEYWAPEAASEHEPTGPPADVYSLGIVLYHALTGAPPFRGENPLAVGLQHSQAPVPDLPASVRSADPALTELVTRMLRKDPASRPSLAEVVIATKGSEATDPSATLVAPTLAATAAAPTEQPPPTGRRRRLVAIGAAALGALVLAGAGVGTYLAVSGGDGGDGAEAATESSESEDSADAVEVASMRTPPIVGSTLSEAREELATAAEAAGAQTPRVTAEERVYSDAQPEGRIISQSPTAGGYVKSAGAVTVSVSEGAATITVPDTTGTVQAVTQRLEAVDLTPNVIQESSFEVPSGVVIRSDPASGESIRRPASVDVVASSGFPSDAIEIVRDVSIAGWPTGAGGEANGGRLSSAETIFGAAASKVPDGGVGCDVAWPEELGMRGSFYNLGGADPCGPLGQMSQIVMTGPRFVTDRGLAIGGSLDRLMELYPDATEGGASASGFDYVLAEQFLPFGEGGASPSLVATIADGVVTRLIVSYPSGGD